MGGEYGAVIIICPICGVSLSVLPKVFSISINRFEFDHKNSNLQVEWRGNTVYHECKEVDTE